jgi:phenylacetate-CoA ligase
MMFFTPKESWQWLHALWEHRRNLRLTRAQLEALQQRKFRRLVQFAFHHSPYYRKLMQERRIDPANCMPADFPVLTKQEVMEHFDDLVTDRRITRQAISGFLAGSTDPMERFLGRYHVLHSSGTSGTVGYFVFSHAAWIKGASHVVRASPLRLQRKRTAYVAAAGGHFAGATLMLTGNLGSNRLFYDVRTLDY